MKRVVIINECSQCPDCSIDRCTWELQGKGVVCYIPSEGIREDCPHAELTEEIKSVLNLEK